MSEPVSTFAVGHREQMQVEITAGRIDSFAGLSGDDNPLHMDDAYAARFGFPRRVVHGVLSIAFVSALIGTRIPGPGALWRSLQVRWLAPLYPGDTLTLEAVVCKQSSVQSTLFLSITGTNQSGQVVLRGDAVVGRANNVAVEPNPQPTIAGIPSQGHAADGSCASRPVFVTGGSGGIGRAVAIALARRGHPVAVGYLKGVQAASDVVETIVASGGRAIAVAQDLTNMAAASSAVTHVRQMLGSCPALVHCASPLLMHGTWDQVGVEALERYFRVYVSAALSLAQAMQVDWSQTHWGRVVLLGTAAQIGAPPPQLLAYVTAKSALEGLCKALAVEVGVLGVTVNLVAPGMTPTALVQHVPPRARMLEAQRTPLRRLATPADTAELVAFLMSDSGAFISGAQIPVTGGLSMS